MKKELYIETKAKIKNVKTNEVSVKRFYYKYLVNEEVVNRAIKNKLFKENPFILPFYLGEAILLDSNDRLTYSDIKNFKILDINNIKVMLDNKVIY